MGDYLDHEHVGNCGHYALRVRKPRRRCKSWNYTNTIPVEESDGNDENFVSGASVICLSKDHLQLFVSRTLYKYLTVS